MNRQTNLMYVRPSSSFDYFKVRLSDPTETFLDNLQISRRQQQAAAACLPTWSRQRQTVFYSGSKCLHWFPVSFRIKCDYSVSGFRVSKWTDAKTCFLDRLLFVGCEETGFKVSGAASQRNSRHQNLSVRCLFILRSNGSEPRLQFSKL